MREDKVLRKEFDLKLPAGMNALVFNTRREVFADERVRRALITLFDFEWMNAKLFHGLYERSQSYFARSELSAHGKPADARERDLLAPFRRCRRYGDHGGHLSAPPHRAMARGAIASSFAPR